MSQGDLFREGKVCLECLPKTFALPGIVHQCYHQSHPATAINAFSSVVHRTLGTFGNRVDAYIAPTEFVKETYACSSLGLENIRVKPHFVEIDMGFVPDPIQVAGRAEKPFALFVGRLSEEKGVQTLLKAWQTVGDVLLNIIGDGPMNHLLRDTPANVRWLGWLEKEDTYRWMGKASCLVLPSSASERYEIGAHSIDHPDLTSLKDDESMCQILGSKRWVEHVTQKPCVMFCPPMGRFRANHVRQMLEAGFAGFRSVELSSIARPSRTSRIVELTTTIQVHPAQRLKTLKNAVRRKKWRRVCRLMLMLGNSRWTDRADAWLRQAESSGGVFHLWGHSWEIEEKRQWRELEKVFASLASIIRAGRATTMTNGAMATMTNGAMATNFQLTG